MFLLVLVSHMSLHREGRAHITANLNLLASGKYYDIVVKLDGREIHLHRSIICPRSLGIARELAKRKQVENTPPCEPPEGAPLTPLQQRGVKARRLRFSLDFDPKTIARAINYFYTLTLTDHDLSIQQLLYFDPVSCLPLETNAYRLRRLPETPLHERLVANINAFQFAKKYQIRGMAKLALQQYLSLIQQDWDICAMPTLEALLRDVPRPAGSVMRNAFRAVLEKRAREVLNDENCQMFLDGYSSRLPQAQKRKRRAGCVINRERRVKIER